MSRKMKMPAEDKIKPAEKCLRREIALAEAAGIAGVSPGAVQGWVTEYQGEGITAFMSQKKSRGYSPEWEEQAVEEHLRKAARIS